eukprot:31331-Pelagococcus_subviridis.AAC.12
MAGIESEGWAERCASKTALLSRADVPQRDVVPLRDGEERRAVGAAAGSNPLAPVRIPREGHRARAERRSQRPRALPVFIHVDGFVEMPRDGEDAAVAVAVERRARPPGDGRSGTRGLVRRERVLPHRRVAAPFAVVVAAAATKRRDEPSAVRVHAREDDVAAVRRVVQRQRLNLRRVLHAAHDARDAVVHGRGLQQRSLALLDALARPRERHRVPEHLPGGRDERDAPRRGRVVLQREPRRGPDRPRGGMVRILDVAVGAAVGSRRGERDARSHE